MTDQGALHESFQINQLVTHVKKKEWGVGKVLHLTGDQALVFFVDADTKRGASKNPLTILTSFLAPSKLQSHPRLDNLSVLQGDTVTDGQPYLSLAESRALFVQRFPRGFADSRYLEKERDYKWAAHEECRELLAKNALTRLLAQGDHGEVTRRALRVAGSVNLATPWDLMALNDGVKVSPNQERFAVAVYDLLHGDTSQEQRFTAFARVLGALPRRQSPALTWPTQTILPFLWDPKRHMFMKPSVTQQAAARCAFNLRYRPEPNWETYSQLLRLAEIIFEDLKDLGPRDNIDVQSFIWLIGEHK